MLDADTKGPLRNIHQRVATTILFESSGGQVDRLAHLPELRFALGEPEMDTTSIDNAALALEARAFFIRKVGSDGFQIRYKPTLKKVVSDRRASLDEDTEIKPAMRALVKREFERGAGIPLVLFPEDSAAVQDSPRLTVIVIDPGYEWTGSGSLRVQISGWTRQRGKSPRLYPGSLIWCVKKPGRDLQEKVEAWLAWKRVALEIAEGTLGGDFDRVERADIQAKVIDAEEAVKDEIWGAYRFVVLADNQEPEGLKVIDLGAGHASSGETLCGRIILTLKSQALLNESVGSGYIDRNWPPALKESGAWPLSSLRQSFLNGALTRLLDPDAVLRNKIVEFVGRGEFGLASGQRPDGTYARVWFSEPVPPEEVSFEAGVFLLTRTKAKGLKTGEATSEAAKFSETGILPPRAILPDLPEISEKERERIVSEDAAGAITLHLRGTIPPEVWNRVGTKLIPKLRSGNELKLDVDFSATLSAKISANMEADLRQALEDLGLGDSFKIEKS